MTTSSGATRKFASNSVTAPLGLDDGPGRHRIGVVLLSNDYVTERDFINARPSDDVALFFARVENTPECTVETLPMMAPHISNTAGLLVPDGRLDVMVYACTSGTVVMGYDKICRLIQSVRPGIQVVTPITASLAALNHFQAFKIAVLTPYTDDINETIANHLAGQGKEICAFTSFLIDDNEVMATVSTEAIFQAALEADRPEAEALFISCTAIRAMEVAESIEKAIGKPVITANQALIWQALRWSGYNQPIPKFGQLLMQTN